MEIMAISFEINDKSKCDVVWRTLKANIKCSHFTRPMFRVKKKRHDVGVYICSYYDDKVNPLIPIETWIIPAGFAPHSGVTPSLTSASSKYHKFRLSLKRGKEFSVSAEKRYNARFIKMYGHLINNKEK